MDWLREIFSRCTAVFHGRRLDDELQEELESHIESAVEENLARGMTPEQARTVALRLFGGHSDQGMLSHAAGHSSACFVNQGRGVRRTQAALFTRLCSCRYHHAGTRHRRKYSRLHTG